MANGKPSGLGRLFIRKSVEQMHAEHAAGELKKTLGPWNLIFLGIGCIIGTGIFVLTGRAAAEFAGPGIMISFVITGTLCALVALAYAELAAAIPVSGSAYSYSYASMGEIVAWVMGLLLVLEYGLAASTVAVGWSGYVVSFLHENLGVNLPHALTQAPGAMVATDAINAAIVNPSVDVNGVTAVLQDGVRVTVRAAGGAEHALATLAFPVHSDAAGSYIDLTSAVQGALQSAVDVTFEASKDQLATVQIPAGAQVTFVDAAEGRQGVRGLIAAANFANAAPIVDIQSGVAAVWQGDTQVTVNGAAAVLKDGTEVTIGAIGGGESIKASLSFPITFDDYEAVGRYNIDLTPAIQATLQAAAEGANQATGATVQIAQGAQLSFLDGAGARGVLDAETVHKLVGASLTPASFNLPALLALAAVTSLLVVGISESAVVNNVVVVIKVAVVIAFIAIGAPYALQHGPENWSPLIPPQLPPPPEPYPNIWAEIQAALWNVVSGENTGRYGVGGLIAGAATIFFAYIGFEAVSTAGAESKNPSRDMPIGILGSLFICTILYILTSAVLVGIVPYTQLNNAAPIATAVDEIGLPWFAVVVKVGAIAGLSSVMLVLLYGQTRIFYTMAKDGLIPSVFAKVHAKFKTPWVNTILVGLLAMGFAGFMGLDDLANLTNVGTLAAFAIICVTVLYLRFARPDMKRPFNMPLPVMLVVSALGALMCVFLLMSLMAHDDTRNFFLIYLAGGFVVYFLYGLWNSKLGKGQTVQPNQ